MHGHWQLDEAKRRFSELIRSVEADGPQFVTRPQCPGQPGPVRQDAQQHRPGMPDQTLPARSDLQPVIPPHMLHAEERS